VSWLGKRALVVLLLAIATGVVAAVVWPGDPAGDPMTGAHFAGLMLILAASMLLVVAAVLIVITIVGGTWRRSGFNPNEFLNRKRD
jgi:uncharacterized membrane protein